MSSPPAGIRDQPACSPRLPCSRSPPVDSPAYRTAMTCPGLWSDGRLAPHSGCARRRRGCARPRARAGRADRGTRAFAALRRGPGDVTPACGCREPRPRHATRRYSLIRPPTRACLRRDCNFNRSRRSCGGGRRGLCPAPPPAGHRLPPLVLAGLGLPGAVMLAIGAALLVAPVQATRLWRWPLTAPTGPARTGFSSQHTTGETAGRLGPSAGILVNCLTRLVCLPADPQARRKSPSR